MTKAEKRIFKEYVTKQKKQGKRQEEIDCMENALKRLAAAVKDLQPLLQKSVINEQFSDILKNAEDMRR